MAVILFIFAILAILIFIGIFEKNSNAVCKSMKSLEGRVAVVTGGTSGMGLEVATDFARRGAKVIIACPFEDEGKNARTAIVDTTGNNKVIFKLLDLASLSSVRHFAEDILKSENRLDILMNNAGVGIPENKKSYNGAHFIMQVNYFGHFLLTMLLLPLLKKSGTKFEPSRIVNTSSLTQRFGNSDSANFNIKYNTMWQRLSCYCNSKYSLVLFSHVLSKKLQDQNVIVNAVDPGIVATDIYKSWNTMGGAALILFLRYFYKTPWEGAQTALVAALDENAAKVSGQFFKNCKLGRARESAYDDKLGEKLWQDSLRVVELDKGEQEFLI